MSLHWVLLTYGSYGCMRVDTRADVYNVSLGEQPHA